MSISRRDCDDIARAILPDDNADAPFPCSRFVNATFIDANTIVIDGVAYRKVTIDAAAAAATASTGQAALRNPPGPSLPSANFTPPPAGALARRSSRHNPLSVARATARGMENLDDTSVTGAATLLQLRTRTLEQEVEVEHQGTGSH